MLFRKTRTHFQGASNRSSDRLSRSNNNLTLYKSSDSIKNLVAKTEVKNPFTSVLKKRSQMHNKFRSTQNFHKHSLSFQDEGSEAGVV
jgi:hypothetical protein